MKIKQLHITLGLLFHFAFTTLHAQIYVNTNVSGGTHDGSSWANAYAELSAAINNSNTGDQLWVAQGTYFPTSTINRDIAFDLPQGISIYGGFLGNETSLNQRDWTNHVTILSGNIGDAIDKTDNSYIILSAAQTVTHFVLDGLTIEGGYANGIYQKSGAGLYINAYATPTGSYPTIANCIFQNNYSENGGGAVYVETGNGGKAAPSFQHCIFQNNESGSSGGAVYNSGYSNISLTPTFTDCIFSNNLSGESGGAVFNHGGLGGSTNPIFKECDFESNTATNGHGGGMYNLGSGNNSDASPTIINCRFFDNSGYAAGGIYNNGTNMGNSSPTITNCTFSRNFTTGYGGTGGAIYCNGSESGNSSAVITNCIIWGNNAPFGSHVLRSVEGSPTIKYCLVDVADCSALQSGTLPNVTCGAGMIFNIDPLFTYEAGGDLTLQPNSPAMNAGDNTANLEPIDLAKSSRITNATIDLGAYETAASALPIELISFRAQLQKDQVKLSWLTASEQNNNFFTIQHSVDGIYFEDIKKVNSAGNSSEIQSYFAFDNEPSRGVNYYRLMQTDFDGTTTFSQIESVKVYTGKISAFPNPVINQINITFSDFEKGKIEYGIFNIYGKEVYREKVEIEDGLHVIGLDQVRDFLPGIYFIKIFNSPNGEYVYKFQKVTD